MVFAYVNIRYDFLRYDLFDMSSIEGMPLFDSNLKKVGHNIEVG